MGALLLLRLMRAMGPGGLPCRLRVKPRMEVHDKVVALVQALVDKEGRSMECTYYPQFDQQV